MCINKATPADAQQNQLNISLNDLKTARTVTEQEWNILSNFNNCFFCMFIIETNTYDFLSYLLVKFFILFTDISFHLFPFFLNMFLPQTDLYGLPSGFLKCWPSHYFVMCMSLKSVYSISISFLHQFRSYQTPNYCSDHFDY